MVPRQIIYIILNPTYFTALCPPLKPIQRLACPPIPCSSPGAGAAPPPGAGTQGSGEKDAKGKRRKRRWQGWNCCSCRGLLGGLPAHLLAGPRARTGKSTIPHGSGSQAPRGLRGQGVCAEAQKQGLEF